MTILDNAPGQPGQNEDGNSSRPIEELERVVIRFVGDSGDGMQLTGSEFSKAMGRAGHHFATHPDYPSEIAAPTGTLFGVSGFQVQLGTEDVRTSGDAPDMLVVMNPAALKTNLPDAKRGAVLIVNSGAFTPNNLEKASYQSNPLEDGSLDGYRVFEVDISGLTASALEESGLTKKEISRCKNYFALGMMLCLYGQPPEALTEEIRAKFNKKDPQIAEGNVTALRAGHAYAEAAEIFVSNYQVKKPQALPGTYRIVTGNQATALGCVAASELSGVPLFLGSYPITPATDILHELSGLKHFNVTTFQAEDEIGGICSSIGAAYGGVLGLTTTSGPGMALKTEALGLAVMLEIPLVIVNVQRGGPSTGLPTKVEQSDLLQAVYGRNGECPIPVLAAASPADCFDATLEAFRIAVKYMTPVILLTDGGIANAAEPWRIPEIDSLPPLEVKFRTEKEGFMPYARDEHLARAWVRPGTPGMEHRIGGLEKDFLTGNISHVPANHQRMVETRAAKVAGIVKDIPPCQVAGPESGELLVVSWGGTYGSIAQACEEAVAAGKSVAHLHLRHIHPFPPNLGEVLKRYQTILVPEMNLGQLSRLLREEYLTEVISFGKVQGKPFQVSEILGRINELCGK